MEQNARFPIFRERLQKLMNREHMSVTEFAEKLGMSRQTVGFYINGNRIPDALTLAAICERCSVSADWLLGLSDVKSDNDDMKVTCKFTGLSEDSINTIRIVTHWKNTRKALEAILEYNPASFFLFVRNLGKGMSIEEKYGNNHSIDFESIPEETREKILDLLGIDSFCYETTVSRARDQYFASAYDDLRDVLLHDLRTAEGDNKTHPIRPEDLIAELEKLYGND